MSIKYLVLLLILSNMLLIFNVSADVIDPNSTFIANMFVLTNTSTCIFNDTSPIIGVSYWDFGDGSWVFDTNSTHIYSLPGSYNISHTIYNTSGIYTTEYDNFVLIQNPILHFNGEMV